MKMIRCGNCKSWHSVTKTSICVCWCSRSYYRLLRPDSDKVMVHGPCTVWTVPDKQFLKTPQHRPHPGMVVQMQWVKEPHKNILRVSKEKILFRDYYQGKEEEEEPTERRKKK